MEQFCRLRILVCDYFFKSRTFYEHEYTMVPVRKRIVHPKGKFLSSFTHPQVVSILYNTFEHKRRYFEKKRKNVDGPLIFGIWYIWYFFPCYGSLWEPSTVWLPLFLKISSFVFNRIKKLIQVWNNLRVSKWWQNFNFWWTIPLNSHCLYNFVFLSSLCI